MRYRCAFCAIGFVVAILSLLSCSGQGPLKTITEQNQVTSHNTIKTLQAFNASLNSRQSRSIGWIGWLTVAITDSKGAYDGAKVGSKIGALLGPKGSVAGALVGGVIAGSAASFSQYEIARDISQFSPYNINNMHVIVPPQETIVIEYVETEKYVCSEDYNLGISMGLDSSYVEVAIRHNLIMDQVTSTNFEDVGLVIDNKLNDVEKEIVYSEEYSQAYTNIVSDPFGNNIECNANTDYIMNLFIDAIYSSCKDKTDLENIITSYTAITKQSNEITKEEKDWLYTAFAVMAYSFDYWTLEWPYVE